MVAAYLGRSHRFPHPPGCGLAPALRYPRSHGTARRGTHRRLECLRQRTQTTQQSLDARPGEARYWATARHGSDCHVLAPQSYLSSGNLTDTAPSTDHHQARHLALQCPNKAGPQRTHGPRANQTRPKGGRDSTRQLPYSGNRHIHTDRHAQAPCSLGPENRSHALDSSNRPYQTDIPRAIHAHHPGIPRVQHDSTEPGPRHPKNRNIGHTTPTAASSDNTSSRAKKAPLRQDRDTPPSDTSAATNRTQWQWRRTARDRIALPDQHRKRPSRLHGPTMPHRTHQRAIQPAHRRPSPAAQ